MKTLSIWMETRCASTATDNPNWIMPENCHQTSFEGGFFSNITSAKKHFISCGWAIIDDDWWCPVCAKILKDTA